MAGKLFILSGQSGVGKNTILKAILEKYPDFHRAVTYTTREPRPEEIPGKDHFFVYHDKFNDMIKNDEFLEFAKTHGEMYGTPKEQIEKALNARKNILMEIDVKGATQVKKLTPDAVLIFIKYDSNNIESIIRNRLKNDPSRGEINEIDIHTRIATAIKESEYEKHYDHSVINPEGRPQEAIDKVSDIIKKELNK
ncbi:MAG: guanylate kinase, guanylate kinase [Candidatus Berkelbacteria bacterium]|nr:guanylate kinase, guanylate kinase [Candidatus Berkelbacteria bacterium]